MTWNDPLKRIASEMKFAAKNVHRRRLRTEAF